MAVAEQKEFDLSDALAVLADQTLAGRERYYDSIGFMLQRKMTEKELGTLFEEVYEDFHIACRECLIKQYPKLEKVDTGSLTDLTWNLSDEAIQKVVENWIAEQIADLKQAGMNDRIKLSPLPVEEREYFGQVLRFAERNSGRSNAANLLEHNSLA